MTGEAKVALVSGGNGGIGRAAIDELHKAGFTTVSLQLDDEAAAPTDLVVTGDVRSRSDCAAAIDLVGARYGRLDAVVNCAGVNMFSTLLDTPDDRARDLFEVNMWGTLNLVRAAFELLAHGGGSITTITSTAGELGIPGTSVYGMSKAALDSMTRTLAVEWATHAIRVNSISATIVRTAMNAEFRQDSVKLQNKIDTIPIGRMLEPSEIGAAVAFLCGEGASAITGHTLRVDGGVVVSGS